jgi:hypothetical protein
MFLKEPDITQHEKLGCVKSKKTIKKKKQKNKKWRLLSSTDSFLKTWKTGRKTN